ncbi:MAG: glycosyltransferase family 4 protein [Clostridia bacterium]|nr:glycosyltransferase family 4 protein [Clostridia bacterium]
MKNKSKVLILSIYPAPYRMSLFELYLTDYDVDVFFEHSEGDSRNENWFQQGNYGILDNPDDEAVYNSINIKDYSLVLVFEYASITAIKLIQKCKYHHIPYVINCDGIMMTKHGNFIKDLIKRYLIRNAAMCFASGENAKQYFLKYGAKEDNIVIHTFSTLVADDILKSVPAQEKKKLLREQLDLPVDANIAIAVGRFIPLKRYDELIRAWKNMPDDYVLTIIGGGEEEERYKQTIAELGLDNIILLPFFQKEELINYYMASDVFVHPTSFDVWGLVVTEAMAFGLPTVVSDHCVAGLELIVNGKNGYIVPVGDDNALCDRVQEILSDCEMKNKMSKNALKTIEPYTIQNMAQIHINAMKRILKDD